MFQCKDLYFCVKEAMERAAVRNSGRVPGKAAFVSTFILASN